MTVIAWDGKTLAADKMADDSGLRLTVTKVRRAGDLLVASSGCSSTACEMYEWIAAGRKSADFPKRQLDNDTLAPTMVIDGGKILHYWSSPIPIVVEDKISAMGSGRDYALAAMHLGKSASEAVLVASYFESGCGCGFDALELD